MNDTGKKTILFLCLYEYILVPALIITIGGSLLSIILLGLGQPSTIALLGGFNISMVAYIALQQKKRIQTTLITIKIIEELADKNVTIIGPDGKDNDDTDNR